MPKEHYWRRSYILLGALLLCLSSFKPEVVVAQEVPAGGPDSIILYNDSLEPNRDSLEPTRRIANLPPFINCSAASPDSFALGSSHLQSVVLVDGQGNPRKRVQFGGAPRRISGHPDGYLVVTNRSTVADVRLDGTIRRDIASHVAVNAVPLPAQMGIVILRTSGDLALVSWEGETKALFTSESAGRTILIKDVAVEDGTNVVALDSAKNEIITLDLSLKEVRRTVAPFDFKEITAVQSSKQRLVAMYQDKTTVRLFKSDGSTALYQSKTPVSCAMALTGEGLGLGLTSTNLAYVPLGVNANLDSLRPSLTATSLFAFICYSLLASLGFALLIKRFIPTFWSTWWQAQETSATPDSAGLSPAGSIGSKILNATLFICSLGGLGLSWWIYPEVRAIGSLRSWGWYWLGALISSASLLYLGHTAGLYRGLASVRTPSNGRPQQSASNILVFLALSSVVLIHYLMQTGGNPILILWTWIAGQVFFLSAFSSPLPKIKSSFSERAWVFALLAATVATRVYKWTECPPNTHFDFGITADEAVMVLHDNWYPLFELRAGQTIGRLWLLQMAASMWLFGIQEWAVRVPSLIWFVALVWGCYLLGRETVSHRFGLIFGVLVVAQHNLLSYSRLPYVTESTAPFVFCLYFACRGIKYKQLRDWAFAGAWAGWSMMTVRTFTTFPLIGAGIVIYLGLVHLRTLWAYRTDFLVMATSMVVVFSPHYYFYANNQHLSYRLAGSSPLLAGNKLTTDLSVWFSQMGSAFGAILRHPDRPPWPSESSDPICMAITGSLFGAGLLFLLFRGRSLATPVALISIAGSIGFGSGFLTNPPSYYHHFVGLVFVMFVVAIPLECVCQAIGAIRVKLIAAPLSLGMTALIALSAYEQVRPFTAFCSWALEGKGDALSPRNLNSVMSQHLLARRHRRFVTLVYPQKGPEIHHSNCSIFYGQFSERHEINNPIASYLPMRPTAQPKDVEFLTLNNLEQLDQVRKIYPGGTEETLFFDSGRGKLLSYTVSAAQIQATYETSLSTGTLFNREFYSLTPKS